MKKLSIYVMILVFFLSIGLFTSKYVFGQEDSSGLSISPVTFELNAEPGDKLTNQIKIYNPTNSTLTLNIKLEDLTATGDEGQVVLSEPVDDSSYSIAKWITVTPSVLTLEAKDEAFITFDINIPNNAEPGGHYGSIVASLSGATQEVTGSSVGSDRGALILLKVAGNVEEELLIDTFEAPSFSEYGPIHFDITFENMGNVHVKPQGFVTITNFAGDQITQLEIPRNNVIPGAKRQADVDWEDKNLIGRYTATLVANYGEGNSEVITDSITFIVFPWKVALLILVVVVLVSIILFKGRKRFGKAVKALTSK